MEISLKFREKSFIFFSSNYNKTRTKNEKKMVLNILADSVSPPMRFPLILAALAVRDLCAAMATPFKVSHNFEVTFGD